MSASSASAATAVWPYHEDIRWLRTTALQRLVAGGIVTGLVWFIYQASWLEIIDLGAWSGPLSLLAFSLLASMLIDRWGPLPAPCVYLAGMAVSVLLAARAYSYPALLSLLALPVGAAGLLIGTGASFLAAAVIDVALLAGALLLPRPWLPLQAAWLTGVSVAAMALLLWVAMYPLRMTLRWAWASYEQARRQTEALLDHKGQLNRTLKDLDAAYHRLEIMAGELERARQAAVEARRLKAEFAANISHELRTPLNLIIGFSEMMAMAPQTYDGQSLPPAYRGDVQAIYRSAAHLSHLIDDVLDLSQIEAGRMGLVKEPIALAEVIAEAANTVSPLFEGKGLSFATRIPPDLPPLEADRTRVRQVLINLLNNAARFTDQGGVTLTASRDERDITVAVADTGVGIAPENLGRLFEEFRQVDGSTRRRYGGSGLGLAISKRFVELHGGRMWAESELGQGTTFYFTLPLRAELGISQLPAEWETWARVSARGDERTIIVADRVPETARLFQRYLDGYQVRAAIDREELRQLAGQGPVHALVVVASSSEEGWQELRRVREGVPDLPVAVCTLQGGARASQPPGVKSYLTKPVSQEHFLSALAALGAEVHSLLIVDDDPEVVRLLSRMVRLAPRPYRVLKAYGGEEALAILRRRHVEAVVLDLLMPEVDGYTVLERMQADERLRGIPVIIVTAKGLEEETIIAGLVAITRREGLSIGELMRCLKADLDALRPLAPPDTAPGRSTAPPA